MTFARKVSLFAAILVLGIAGIAGAAATVRTTPINNLVFGGHAYCAAVNGGTATALVTTTLYGEEGAKALANDSFTLSPREAGFGTQRPTGNNPSNFNPTWCECIVPDKAKVRCSFIYVNGNNVTVAPAQ